MAGRDIEPGAGTDSADPDEEEILAALRQGGDSSRKGAITEIVDRYGAARVLASVHRLDLMPYAEGWMRFSSRPDWGGMAEWTRTRAVSFLTGESFAFDSPLTCLNAREAYSFQLRPSFRGHSLVRVADYNGRVMLSGFIGGRWNTSDTENPFREVTAEEWRTLRANLDQAGFWTLPEDEPQRGLDGEIWIIEGYAGARRHRVQRWCPEAPEIRSLGEAFMTLAKAPKEVEGPVGTGGSAS